MATRQHPEDVAPHRIRVVGVSGSGESRLADRLAADLDLPRLELDAVFWGADWTKRPLDEAHRLLDAFLATSPDGWVIDGGWSSRMRGRLERLRGQREVDAWVDDLVMRKARDRRRRR